ncbi:MAG: hypothetical protein Ta2D_09970 [Rickettsiales bacterium]|nr:MAG: hypothetical protein Ta2D_09970 [Rickettsiales bacterium]
MADLYTIIIQAINFLVFLFLLNKFLFKPVSKVIDEKRENIKNLISDAENKVKEAEKLEDEYYKKLQDIENEKDKMLEEIRVEVDTFRLKEDTKIREETAKKSAQLDDFIEKEKENFLKTFNDNFGELFFQYADAIFKKLANTNLQQELLNVFIEKINELSAEKVKELDNEDIKIISCQPLIDAPLIEKTLKNKGFNFKNIEYEVDDSLILGFELKIGGYLLSWSAREIIREINK